MKYPNQQERFILPRSVIEEQKIKINQAMSYIILEVTLAEDIYCRPTELPSNMTREGPCEKKVS